APPAAADPARRKARTPTRRALRITFGPCLLRPSRRSASAGDPRRHHPPGDIARRITKHVTAHTLRHTAATWLRQATGEARLVAEYLGHADLSTVSRYAHVASEELHEPSDSTHRKTPPERGFSLAG